MIAVKQSELSCLCISKERDGNDLNHEAIFKLTLQAMVTKNILKFGLDRGLNTGQIPPHPPTKKVSVPDRSLEG